MRMQNETIEKERKKLPTKLKKYCCIFMYVPLSGAKIRLRNLKPMGMSSKKLPTYATTPSFTGR